MKSRMILLSAVLCAVFSASAVSALYADETASADSLYVPGTLSFSHPYTYELSQTASSGPAVEKSSSINWHKIMGWTTMGLMTTTIASGRFIPHNGHCILAGVATGAAVATTVSGFYSYGGLISFSDGDIRYNAHAILGTLATAGFITTLALADGKPHVATGVASGIAFVLTLGVIYF